MRKDEYIKKLEDALEWIIFRADETLENSTKLRSDDARAVRRIADRAEKALESTDEENHKESKKVYGKGHTSPA